MQFADARLPTRLSGHGRKCGRTFIGDACQTAHAMAGNVRALSWELPARLHARLSGYERFMLWRESRVSCYMGCFLYCPPAFEAVRMACHSGNCRSWGAACLAGRSQTRARVPTPVGNAGCSRFVNEVLDCSCLKLENAAVTPLAGLVNMFAFRFQLVLCVYYLHVLCV